MGLSAPTADWSCLNLAARPNEVRNVWYEVQVQDLLGHLMYTKKMATDEYRGILTSFDTVIH